MASQMVVRSLQLQLRGLLAEAMEQPKAIPPRVVIDQIEAAIRVANNLVAEQNDRQKRSARQRMGTTLVMALVLPQRIDTPNGPAEVNELYLTHIGDSRAYWITPDHCQLLTVDDDIAGREVSAGNSFANTARQRPDADALSQAVGVQEYAKLRPHTQRFLFDSTGVLLLCSDGLSDNRQVELSWANYIGLIVKKVVPLEAAAESWVELANQKNGHDDVAVVLMSVHIDETGDRSELSPTNEVVAGTSGLANSPLTPPKDPTQTEMTAASRALLYGETEEDDRPLTPEEMAAVKTELESSKPGSQKLITALLAAIVIGVVGIVGWLLWRTFEPVQTPPPSTEQEQS